MSVPMDDRALQYGDGLFETLRVERRRAPFWTFHLERLLDGCERLRLPGPAPAALWSAVCDEVPDDASYVVKLLLSAGSGPRGYARPEPVAVRVYVQAAPLAETPALRSAIWCELRCALQPRLAGLKHLNRLEQVLARMECQDASADEGLMLDHEGRVISATTGNLLIRCGGRWLTPRLDACGVAGVARRWLMQSFPVSEATLTKAEVDTADCLVISNAVHGPRQLLRLAGRHYAADLEVTEWRRCWRQCFEADPA
ncbi:MAG: aminodeoxychorismate lyase [Lysobacterales bacterium]